MEREPNDFYRTPPQCTRALLTVETFSGAVWEPACGDGAISEVLDSAGYFTISTDLLDRGYGSGLLDFLSCGPEDGGQWDIITNPPYKLAEQFIRKAIGLGAAKVAMLLRLSFLEGERRRAGLFNDHPPSRVWVLSARPTLWHGTDPNARTTGGAIAFAWFVWDAAWSGPTTLGWLSKESGDQP